MKHTKLIFEQYILQTAINRVLGELHTLGDLQNDYGFNEESPIKVTVVKGRIIIESIEISKIKGTL